MQDGMDTTESRAPSSRRPALQAVQIRSGFWRTRQGNRWAREAGVALLIGLTRLPR